MTPDLLDLINRISPWEDRDYQRYMFRNPSRSALGRSALLETEDFMSFPSILEKAEKRKMKKHALSFY